MANPAPALSFSISEMAGFFRHLSDACTQYATSGTLPPPLFPMLQMPPLGAGAPAPANSDAQQQQPQVAATVPSVSLPLSHVQQLQLAASFQQVAHVVEKKKKKERRKEKRTRAPTGYNLFVRHRLEKLKAEGGYQQYADSKAAFKAAVDDWKGMNEGERRAYMDEHNLHSVPLNGTAAAVAKVEQVGSPQLDNGVQADGLLAAASDGAFGQPLLETAPVSAPL